MSEDKTDRAAVILVIQTPPSSSKTRQNTSVASTRLLSRVRVSLDKLGKHVLENVIILINITSRKYNIYSDVETTSSFMPVAYLSYSSQSSPPLSHFPSLHNGLFSSLLVSRSKPSSSSFLPQSHLFYANPQINQSQISFGCSQRTKWQSLTIRAEHGKCKKRPFLQAY
jgi:hypothetical protein